MTEKNPNNHFVIIKNGSFYGEDFKGYTSSISDAGLYTSDQVVGVENSTQGVKVLPFLVALYGVDNIFYDWKQGMFWTTQTGTTWLREECSIGAWMVLHKKCPEAEESPKAGPVSFIPPTLTAADVRAYRDLTGASMMEAKNHLRRVGYEEAMGDFIRDAGAEEKLDFILNWITDKEMGR